jgi:hypothetical protein
LVILFFLFSIFIFFFFLPDRQRDVDVQGLAVADQRQGDLVARRVRPDVARQRLGTGFSTLVLHRRPPAERSGSPWAYMPVLLGALTLVLASLGLVSL